MFFDKVVSMVSTCIGDVFFASATDMFAACACNPSSVTVDVKDTTPPKPRGDELSEALFDNLRAYYSATGEAFDAKAIAEAICILSQQPNKEPLVAVLRLLVERQTQGEEIAALTEAIGELTHALKDIILKESVRNGGPTAPRQLPSPQQTSKVTKVALMGRKTPAMHEQLRAFHRYLSKHGYKGDESRLYAWAGKCWKCAKNRDMWNLAKLAGGTERGYSCPKALADAYRHLSCEQKLQL